MESSATTGLYRPGVLVTKFVGRVTVSLIAEARPHFFAFLDQHHITHWWVDAMEVPGFGAGIRIPARTWLQDFRARGGEEVLVTTRSASVRMIGIALRMTTGLPVRLYEDVTPEFEARLPPTSDEG